MPWKKFPSVLPACLTGNFTTMGKQQRKFCNDACPHNGIPIKGPPETPRTSQLYTVMGALNRAEKREPPSQRLVENIQPCLHVTWMTGCSARIANYARRWGILAATRRASAREEGGGLIRGSPHLKPFVNYGNIIARRLRRCFHLSAIMPRDVSLSEYEEN